MYKTRPYLFLPFLPNPLTEIKVDDDRNAHIHRFNGETEKIDLRNTSTSIKKGKGLRFIINFLFGSGDLVLTGSSVDSKNQPFKNIPNIAHFKKIVDDDPSLKYSKSRTEKSLIRGRDSVYHNKIVVVPTIPQWMDRPLWMHIAQIKFFPQTFVKVGGWVEKGEVLAVFRDEFIENNLCIRSPISGKVISYQDPFISSSGYIFIQPNQNVSINGIENPYSDFLNLIQQKKVFEHYFLNQNLNYIFTRQEFDNKLIEFKSKKVEIYDLAELPQDIQWIPEQIQHVENTSYNAIDKKNKS